MVALNRISADAKRQHLSNVIKEQEKLIMAAALRSGENPDTLDPETHPASSDVEGTLAKDLADRIAAFNRLKTALEGI